MKPRLGRVLLRLLLRESRGARGRLAFLALCVAIGVAAVVGVAGLAGAIEEGIRRNARDLLAADLVVSSRAALPPELDDALDGYPDLRRTNVLELATLAAAPARADGEPGPSRLVELKVVDGEYPFHGALPLDPAGTLAEALDARSAVVAPELVHALGLEVGETLLLGGEEFTVSAVVLDEPDRLDFSLTLGPRVFLHRSGLDRTGLLATGSRVRHRALFLLPGVQGPALDALEERLEDGLPGRVSVETFQEGSPRLRRSIRRVEDYLGLVALLSLVLGGVGVATVVRSRIAGSAVTVAVLRSLGLAPRHVLVVFLGQVLALAALGSLGGAAVGACIPLALPHLAPDLLPPRLAPPWQPLAIVRGLVLGIGVALLFALPALTALWRVPPARVLRSDAEPLPVPRPVRVATGLVFALGLLAAALLQGGSLLAAAAFTGGLFALGGLLVLAARLAIALARRAPRRGWNPYVVHGVAALARPGAGVPAAIAALGLGIAVVGAMALVEERLLRDLAGALPETAPSSFLVDVQPDQWEGVHALLVERRATEIDSVPVVMARLAALDGRGVEALAAERDGRRPRWVLTREQRLTYLAELPDDTRLVGGSWWSDDGRTEVSLEEGYAEDLGAEPGTELVFDVQGVRVPMTVTSLREVTWESFGINFFLIVEPGALEEAPQYRLAAARLETEEEDRLQDALAARFPNVTLLRIGPIVAKLLAVVRRLAAGVRLLGAFTAVAGLAILAGSVASAGLRRAREAALLKALGVSRRGVVALFAAEFAVQGAVAGLLGAVGALGLAWGFLEQVVEMSADLGPGLLLAGPAAGAALAAVAGVAASGRALAVRPIESLRGD